MPMERKRLQQLAALVLAVGLISGCSLFQSLPEDQSSQETPSESPSQSPEQSPQESPSHKVMLRVFQYQGDYKEAYDQVTQKFSESNKDISLSIESPKEGKDYREALKARFNSGDEPDVFNISGPQDILTWKDKLSDLSGMEATQFVIEGLLKDVTVEDQVYGLPYSIEGYGLVYNTEILEKAQIDIEKIDSFQALEIAVKKLDEQKKDLKIDAVFAFPAKENAETGLYLSNLFLSPEFEGDAFKTYYAKTVAFKYGDAFKKLVDLFNQYSVQPSYEMDYKKQVEEFFLPGKVAIIPQGSWIINTIENSDKKMLTKIGLMPFPVEGFKENASPIGVSMYWAVNKSKPQEVQKAARDFINWLYLSEEGQRSISENLKFIPPYKGFSSDSVSDPLSEFILSQARSKKFINWVFRAYPEGWGLNTLGPDISAYVQGKLAWDEVIKKAKSDWEQKRK